MDLNVVLTCLDSGKTEHIKIAIKDWDSKCVKELKEILEDEVQVPACDQNLSYQGRQLNDNLFPLKKLYLRQGDSISVECIAQGNLSEMKGLIKEIKNFSGEVNGQDQSDLLTVCLKKDVASYVSYDYIDRALEHLSFNYFIPWKNAQSVVHRHYFVQEGAFDAFMEVLKFASKRYRIDEKPNSRKFFAKSKEKEFDALIDQLKDLNNEQMILQMHCLSLLWNFSETLHDRRLVLRNGGLELVIKALMLDPHEYSLPDEYYEVASINETAVGCLVQYAEFPDCQEVIARSSETVGKLMFMVGSQFQFPHENGPMIDTYNKYSAQIAANTLFCCACSLQTPKILAETGMHKWMINLMNLLPEDDLALSYYCTLFLARTRASALVQLDPSTAKCIDDIIASFLSKKRPIDVSHWEEEHNYVWVTMAPFVSLAFSGRQSKEKKTFLEQTDSNIRTELENSGLCECSGMSVSEEHQTVLPADQTDGPTLLPANQADIMETNGIDDNHDSPEKCAGIKIKMEEPENSTSSDAQLCTVSAEGSGMTVGSTQTQKLGLFALQHMVYSSGNRQLFESENLLSYLDCLCWHVNPDDGKLLRAELRKYWSPRTATLAVICKSSLAFVCGFEAAFKM